MKTLLLIVSLFALNANAEFPFIGSFQKNIGKKNNLDCTDFTGKWVGTCTFTDETGPSSFPSEINIDMWSCESVYINGSDYQIGGTKVETDSSRYLTLTSILSVDWNDKKEILSYTVNAKRTVFGGDKSTRNGGGHFKIINGKLHLEQKATDSLSISCEFAKK